MEEVFLEDMMVVVLEEQQDMLAQVILLRHQQVIILEVVETKNKVEQLAQVLKVQDKQVDFYMVVLETVVLEVELVIMVVEVVAIIPVHRHKKEVVLVEEVLLIQVIHN